MADSNKNEAENHLHPTEPRWFAVYTRYKREKMVERHLTQKGIECYLPINRVVRQWGRKRRQVDLPLINCYIFVRITQAEYVPVLETENVLNFVRFAKNLISIPEEQIDLLKRVTGEYGDIDVEETRSQLEAGDRVEIIGGNLTGTQGRLVEKENKRKFTIELEDLGYSLLIEVDPKLIRRL